MGVPLWNAALFGCVEGHAKAVLKQVTYAWSWCMGLVDKRHGEPDTRRLPAQVSKLSLQASLTMPMNVKAHDIAMMVGDASPV